MASQAMGNVMNLTESVTLKLSSHWKQDDNVSPDMYYLMMALFDLEGFAFVSPFQQPHA